MKIKQEHATYAMIVIVSLVLGFIIGIWWANYSVEETDVKDAVKSTTNNSDYLNTVGTTTSTTDSRIFINALAQKAGPSVVIDGISVRNISWAVITEDIAGKPGRILGAQKVLPGEIKTEVDLLRGTVSENIYHAIIYQDDGDGKFDFKVDSPVLNTNGSIVESVFRAS
jgi:hypothetical protein